MRTNTKQAIGRSHGTVRWVSRIMGVSKIMGGMLLLALLANAGPAFGVTIPSTSQVTLAWDSSPNPDITGYNVYSGTSSGNYTTSVAVGNVTTNVVAGLTGGVTYYFVVTAISSAGLESAASGEVSYLPGQTSVQLRTAGGQMILTVSGQIGSTYNLQASTDLINWTVIGTGLVPAGGSLEVTDPNAASFPKRFYRAQ